MHQHRRSVDAAGGPLTTTRRRGLALAIAIAASIALILAAPAIGSARSALRAAFPHVSVTPMVADFTRPLDLTQLDGIVMANSLHFERDKLAVLRLVRGYLRPGGRFVLVEYDTDHGNQWVPHPLSFGSWATLAAEAGFRDTRRLASVPSRFLGSIYSALSIR